MPRKRPAVLMLDDDPDDIRAQAIDLEEFAAVTVRRPQDVKASDVNRATVILIDYKLTNWPERDAAETVALQPANGVALASILRSYSDAHCTKRPRAFAIHSGQLAEIAGSHNVRLGEHTLASTINLEWVFQKGRSYSGTSFRDQMRSLADGVHRLPAKWPRAGKLAFRALSRLLSLSPAIRWRERAMEDVATCRPPAHSWSDATDGLAFARWLLHGVLPYPCFLWDVRYLAARLRVTPESLSALLRSGKRTADALSEVEYRGIFAGFAGDRWWRSGVEHFIWGWTKGQSSDASVLRAAVEHHLSRDLDHIEVPRPVVVVDQHFRPSNVQIDISEAVEVRPDYWPTYAEQAWVSRDTAIDDSEILALVARSDLPLTREGVSQ